MIRFTNVSMTYPDGNEALRNINLEVAQGAMVYITGRSGAGKSTLLRLIALIDRASRGQIIINGQNLERVRRGRIPFFRRQIGFMFQDHRLLFDRTVFDNVALPLVIAGYRHQEIRKRVQAALDKVALSFLLVGTSLPIRCRRVATALPRTLASPQEMRRWR